jgi:hypothetical protein
VIVGQLLLVVLLVNAAYCIRKILEDWERRSWGMVALGAFCVIGINGLLGWMLYTALASSTDL